MDTFRCIAVDMGASSIRVLCGIINDNKIEYEEVFRFKNEIQTIEGEDKWDIQNIYNGILKGTELSLKKYSDLSSIGVDSWGVDYALLDKEGRLMEIPYSYRDSRTEGMFDEWSDLMTKSDTWSKTGINFYIFNTLFQLLAAKDSKVLKEADKLLFTPCYISYKLTGLKKNELTIASTSQMLTIDGRDFNTEILDKLNLSPELLGKTIDPGTILGPVNESSLPTHNLQCVSVCGHDTASAVAAIPFDNDHSAFLSTGTWCILGFESSEALLSEKALEIGITNERGFGNTYRVLKNIVGLWLVQGLQKDLPEIKHFAELEKLATESSPTQLLINPEDESFYNPESMINAFNLYFEKTHQKKPDSTGQYVQCAYNSLGLIFSMYITLLEKLSGKQFSTLHMIGGGSRSELFCQTTANLTGKKVIAGPAECSALGNIMVQAIGMGQIKDIKEGRSLVRNSVDLITYTSNYTREEREILTNKFKTIKLSL